MQIIQNVGRPLKVNLKDVRVETEFFLKLLAVLIEQIFSVSFELF